MALIQTVPIDDANKRAITMKDMGRQSTAYVTLGAMHSSEASGMTSQGTTVSADVAAMTAAGMTHTTMPCVAAVATAGVASAMPTTMPATVTTAAVCKGKGAQQQAKGHCQSSEYATPAARTLRGRPCDHVLDPL